MKRKEGIVTVVICVIVVLAGSIGFSFLYQILLQTETMIEGEVFEEEDWVQAKEEKKREILYPFFVWKENASLRDSTMTIWEVPYEWFDLKEMQHTLLKLVGILEDSETSLYDIRSYNHYTFLLDDRNFVDYGLADVFHFISDEEQTDELILAVNNSGLPVLCQYHARKIEEAENRIISEQLLAEEEVPEICYEDIARVENFLKGKDGYRLFLNEILKEFIIATKLSVEEIPGENLSWMCEHYGEWRCYTDEEKEAYVCVLNTHHIILYYDKETHQFCGYNIAQNKIE